MEEGVEEEAVGEGSEVRLSVLSLPVTSGGMHAGCIIGLWTPGLSLGHLATRHALSV